MNSRLVRRLHRWVGLVFSLIVFTSAGSGILHTVMTWTQPPPPKAGPAGPPLDLGQVKVGIAQAEAALPRDGKVLSGANLRMIGGQPWYVFYRRGEAAGFYVSAVTGKAEPGEDEIFAREIARRFLNREGLRKSDYLTAFNGEYLNIFRILPVYRFDADDARHTRVYVSTTTESVTRATDDAKQFEASVFSNFHKLMFLPNKMARDVTLVVLMGGLLAVASLGIALFFLTRR
ncbi:MAG: PepSY domain-containing protein [Verrucomicrobium sp.]|nr:PepSY domain-containing protein [Verrucomicrobium sp.]